MRIRHFSNKTYNWDDVYITLYIWIRRSVCSCAEPEVPVWQQERWNCVLCELVWISLAGKKRDAATRRIQERSLVFGISISGSKEETRCLKEAYRKGAKTILFTVNTGRGSKQFCTEVVLIPSLRHLNHGNVISPQCPIWVMIYLLFGTG